MKSTKINLMWGFLLIALGALFLVQTMGWLPDLSTWVWAAVFGGVSLAFLVGYVVSGWRSWWLLFPTTVLGAISGTLVLAELNVAGEWIGAMFVAAVSLPFWVAWLSAPKENWWALIPGWATAVVSAVILLANVISGEAVGALIMFGIALPFIVVYLTNREHWWALIPGSILSVLGLVIVFSTSAPGEWLGALVMFGIAAPFLFLYFRSQKNWWALMPAGVMLSIGLVSLLASFQGLTIWEGRLLGTVLFSGWALTFMLLWLRAPRTPTDWAKYPAAGLAVLALLVLLVGDYLELIWGVALIVAGGWLLLDQLRRPAQKG